ncbi:hypothetical protein CMPELA_25670 [Cupriavidus necator]|uniref:Uncharacterized protein n=1 Tax=Cupriavidus necator (strain ATCC 17699 / DSM 428 / KCTC 22496 / NCIMB 10442 / H16 / Stanier 337) TaxID=381666 RepID=Q0K1M4_CUPNH|nr:hypothetical protein [Cupriavidus necator]QQB81026.1 hypothetical protein I6H87_25395 [Cupriavidus necator]WKA42860.1 hypothetical protein QWP09_25860 [Cupriavidus necator]CAJ96100.1 Hypothetical protein H16_B1310 [Cupriavidus necator H16]
MDALTVDALKYLVTVLMGAGAAYGGIRADLRNMRKDIGRAHERIDRHIEGHR